MLLYRDDGTSLSPTSILWDVAYRRWDCKDNAVTSTEDDRSRLDPRVERTRKVVLDAARKLIVEEGQESVTPTRLVAETGVSRSTIYRQWTGPDDIVLEAIATDTQQPPFEPTGDVREDLTKYLNLLRLGLNMPHTKILAARIDRAEHDGGVSAMISGLNQERRTLMADILQHDPEDFDAAHALIVGALFHQRFLAREPITDELIEYVVEAYIAMRRK